ncbi:hypothetical protein DL766_009076 [Monosporascus sp. MC13-8B]|uniref:chitinase n=1 Tax=Monosporascus cannonballus TaxID=155416 RepID=A0ABY0HC17_9PEZI|nr:hypothetical protein DL763_009096 [Monosporascus cannonballus]RYO86995.1 hypothetical protein DL762_004420 [Monosporascus cannonballus]RYP16647.1 hypothetical protein DL766_009076 [Monosporascus sp. MC13-8B]
MQNFKNWLLAHLIPLVASESLLQGRADCASVSTSTIYVLTTIYPPCPLPTLELSNAERLVTATPTRTSSDCDDDDEEAFTTASSVRSTESTVPIISSAGGSVSATGSTSNNLVSTGTYASLSTTIVGSPSKAASGSRESGPTEDIGPKTFKNIAYFTNWSIYGRDYQPQDLPVDKLTHVLHAFADVDKRYSTDSRNDQGRNAYSVAGGRTAPTFMPMAGDAAARVNFAWTAVGLMSDWGFDGIDIDWEYPQTAAEAQNYVLLLQACRRALDDYAVRNGVKDRTGQPVPFPHHRRHSCRAQHLMSYDYAGSWSDVSGHTANPFANSENPKSTPFSTDSAVQYYLEQGIRPHKVLLGLPLYGRAFQDTEGLGRLYSGVGWSSGALGNWEPGVWDYKVLPRSGAAEYYDNTAKAAYSLGYGELISYDNVRTTGVKARYIREDRRLGGAFFWEASGDRTDDRSLIKTMATGLGSLETSENNLKYPTSQYDNIRNGMPGV